MPDEESVGSGGAATEAGRAAGAGSEGAAAQDEAGGVAAADGPSGAAERDRSAEAEGYLAQLQRLKADFDNYRRRMMQEQARWGDAAVGRFVVELLTVVDNLERALGAGGDAQAIRQGVELTLRQLHEHLERSGVQPLQARGQAFDPAYHEAMLQVESVEHRDGEVVEELRRGYLFKGQVLRPALVKVARAPSQAAPGPAPGQAAAGQAPGETRTGPAPGQAVTGSASGASRAARAAGSGAAPADGSRNGEDGETDE